MTMPHLENCRHSEDGWCLECVKVLNQEVEDYRETLGDSGVLKNAAKCPACNEFIYARQVCPKCRASPIPTRPVFQHTAAELKHVANILDLLNNPPDELDSVGFEGELNLFWCDRVMGVVRLDDESDRESWVYEPAARPDECDQ